ncbi:MAG: ATP-binding protein [Elusimicrobiota bacterium]
MLNDVLLLQKRELEKRISEPYIQRRIGHNKTNNGLIKVILGPRRAGKSFLGFHILNKTSKYGYVNFDDEQLLGVKDYNLIVDAINTVYDNPSNLLLDEIQNLDKWELFVNRLQRQGYNLIITGSNSKLLSKELATHLTGRHIPISILPFSFTEFLKIQGKELTTTELKSMCDKYIIYGGYPEPWIKNVDFKEYLSTLFNSIIYKDIVKRFNIRRVEALENLAVYLISNVAREFSYNTLAKVTSCKSVHTIEKYLGYLEESFLFFRINMFSYKLKEQLSANKKIYCIDNGYIHAKAFKLSPDYGKLYENVVAIELKRRELEGKSQVFYWKNAQQEEVDFVVKQGTKAVQLIQVCYDTTARETKDREKRALLKASKELRCTDLLILTDNYTAEEEFKWYGKNCKIKYVPVWSWLLNQGTN